MTNFFCERKASLHRYILRQKIKFERYILWKEGLLTQIFFEKKIWQIYSVKGESLKIDIFWDWKENMTNIVLERRASLHRYILRLKFCWQIYFGKGGSPYTDTFWDWKEKLTIIFCERRVFLHRYILRLKICRIYFEEVRASIAREAILYQNWCFLYIF